jgi:hypothetical protein
MKCLQHQFTWQLSEAAILRAYSRVGILSADPVTVE